MAERSLGKLQESVVGNNKEDRQFAPCKLILTKPRRSLLNRLASPEGFEPSFARLANFQPIRRLRCAFFKMVPEAFLFEYAGKEGNVVKLNFKPNPAFRLPSREAKVLHEMAGEVWVDANQQRLVSINGHLVNDVKFAGGLLGHLEKGGQFAVQAERGRARPLGSNGNDGEHGGQSSSVQNDLCTTERTAPKLRARSRRSNHRRCCCDASYTIAHRRQTLSSRFNLPADRRSLCRDTSGQNKTMSV